MNNISKHYYPEAIKHFGEMFIKIKKHPTNPKVRFIFKFHQLASFSNDSYVY